MKILAILLACILLCGCSADNVKKNNKKDVNLCKLNCISAKPFQNENNTQQNPNIEETDGYVPVNYDIQKGIWISYIDLEPMLTGKTEDEFRKNFEQACKNVCSLGFNTVYVQLRPFGDALYNSDLFPSSRYITGNVGEKGDFDPLEIMVETAHENKLSFHGWINPLRCENENGFGNISRDFKIRQWYDNMENDDKIRNVKGDTHLWLNPAYEEVRTLIAEGAKEIAENYNVDGIHFDDYFYPTTDKDFDSVSFSLMGEDKNIDDWRRENISLMVKEIYNSVKEVNENILVGVSPQGNNENNYSKMYADVALWGSEEGYCDYIEPQIYFGYENSVKPFKQTLEEWKGIVINKNVKLVIGLGAYKIFSEEEFSQTEGIISRQIKDSFSSNCGVGIYTYNSLFTPPEDFSQRITAENEEIRQAMK